MKEIAITKDKANQRIDKFVRRYLNDAPLSFIYKLFRKKDVLKIFVTDAQLEEFNKPKKI